jgi:hypothetical protein
MLGLLHAGIVASRRQFIVVLALTAAFFVIERSDGNSPLSNAALLFLTWSYALIAVGMALTSCKAIDLTAVRLRHPNGRLVSKQTLMLPRLNAVLLPFFYQYWFFGLLQSRFRRLPSGADLAPLLQLYGPAS